MIQIAGTIQYELPIGLGGIGGRSTRAAPRVGEKTARWIAPGRPESSASGQGSGMVRREQSHKRPRQSHRIANFNARIVRDLILDDGDQRRREFGLEAEVGGQEFIFVVSAAEFGSMGWVLRQLGPQAIVYPGQQQHARAAIQCLSGSIQQKRIFTHLGWRKHKGRWVYVHAGGALRAQGARGDLRVELRDQPILA